MYPIIKIDISQSEGMEELGTKRKFWFYDDEGNSKLFKAEERGTGEDWAEKIACELCELIGLPHVYYELAEEIDSEKPGVVCQSCAPRQIVLVLGNQLLFERDSSYSNHENKYKMTAHTVGAVIAALKELQMPPNEWLDNIPEGITSAMEVFTGYLMLDAWIANQDRHHENWAALRVGEILHLAPTFDHGAGLARNHSDEDRKDRLSSTEPNRRISHFSKKARSAIYGGIHDPKPLGTHDLFWRFAAFVPEAAEIWLNQLKQVERSAIQAILDEVPNKRMSKIAKEFTLQLVLENQQRLLHKEQE